MKILVCDPIAESAVQKLKAAGHEVAVKTGMTPEELSATVPGFHAAVVRSATKFRRPAVDAATEMKVIVRGGVGIDNIDYAYAREKGIEVRNTPGASSASVAELAVGHMLAVARHINIANVTMRAGEWNKKKYKGVELAGKTAGLIGLGRIGQETAKRCQAMGMQVIAHDPFLKASPLPDVPLTSLPDLLGRADFVSLHVPFDPEKGAVIGEAEFGKMKDGVFLINCARGGTVDERALLAALESGKVAAAALDVFETEPPGVNELIQHPRVSLTPHIGASTREAQERVGEELTDILIAFAKEKGL